MRNAADAASQVRKTPIGVLRGDVALLTSLMDQLCLQGGGQIVMNYTLTKVRGFFVLGTLNLKYNVSIEWASSN